MSFISDISSFNISKKQKDSISLSLKQFKDSPLSKYLKEDLIKAKKIWRFLKTSRSAIFIFAFGGAGSYLKILKALFPSKNKNICLIDTLDKRHLKFISSFLKTKLKTSHFIFMSKSGQTKEILFYKTFLQDIYLKNGLSLKNRTSVFTSSYDNPLSIWAKKEDCSLYISSLSLPGRFSFFTLNGLLLSQAYNQNFKISKIPFKILDFFTAYYQTKKEIFCCSFDPRLKSLNHWLELSWSESLFKKGAVKPIPLFRGITFNDLVHGYIEELIFKKDGVCFLGLDIDPSTTNDLSADLGTFYPRHIQQVQIKKLLKTYKIPYLFIKLSLQDKYCLNKFIYTFYKIFFCMAQISQSDVLTQPFVDQFKKSEFENKIKK